jgi:predicted nucleic acid-binding protein
LLILDDKLGRRIASSQGLLLTRTAGVLLRAKARRLISSVGECVQELLREGFYLAPEVRDRILTLAAER